MLDTLKGVLRLCPFPRPTRRLARPLGMEEDKSFSSTIWTGIGTLFYEHKLNA